MQIGLSDIKSFEGKVAVVTGGSSGIGHAAATLLASKGATVVIADIQSPPSSSPKSENPSFFQTDVTSWDSQLALFKETIRKYGALDIVLVNAGIGESEQPFQDKVDESGDPVEPSWMTIKVNLMGAMITTKLALHFMRKSKEGGAIVVTGSRASYKAFSIPVYSATKHGVLGMMRGLHAHTPAWNIRINMVAPGVTFTNLLPSDALDNFKRLGLYTQTSEDVAKAIALLAQDTSFNGKTISISQGVYRELEGPIAGAKEAIYGSDDWIPKNDEEFKALLSALVTKFD